ncbi:FadR/GntR family transcriptional regulator [Mycolicibacterium bacteremicum]|uniref:GntR family transcriptional regulator n=1 Tax=Mycolicibacterium bacteremicum TaxID=564198 RepID=A0A1W9YMW1_MYCBA|nr:FadR/GntR family transcriptional regulator [Mycolicibacterium bacteremicum]MCV7433360.1 FadR family transcriptional regulator [Mycolicibacterium bacteremicum]ORA01401.1 GntR family transcriptional regulator [Mycolicibacterium bacteremicum]
MPLASARRTGLVDQAIEQLRQSVASGEWPVNARIPTEPALAESLGVGRNTVREAVRALAHSGILEVRQGDGTYVRATSEVSGALHRLCGTELRDVLQVRRCLEVEAARLAATVRTEADLAELWQLWERTEELRSAGLGEEFARTDAELHFAVVRSAHNPVLTELYRGLTEVVLASVVTSTRNLADSPQHRALIQAIADGDEAAAIGEAGGFLDELLDRLPEP